MYLVTPLPLMPYKTNSANPHYLGRFIDQDTPLSAVGDDEAIIHPHVRIRSDTQELNFKTLDGKVYSYLDCSGYACEAWWSRMNGSIQTVGDQVYHCHVDFVYRLQYLKSALMAIRAQQFSELEATIYRPDKYRLHGHRSDPVTKVKVVDMIYTVTAEQLNALAQLSPRLSVGSLTLDSIEAMVRLKSTKTHI